MVTLKVTEWEATHWHETEGCWEKGGWGRGVGDVGEGKGRRDWGEKLRQDLWSMFQKVKSDCTKIKKKARKKSTENSNRTRTTTVSE